MGQVSNVWFFGRITCLLCILQSVATVPSQNAPIPNVKITYRDNTKIVQVAEDEPLGVYLFQLEVTGGSGLRIRSDSEYVHVVTASNSINRLLVNVTLAQKLDYDGEFRKAKVTFHYGNADYQELVYTVDVYVTNKNDEIPVFLNQPYLITVPENTPQGTTLYTKIQAHDRDEIDTLSYYLEAKGPDVDEDYKTKFIISLEDATITLNGSLDYESNRFYQYSVKVTDTVHEVSTDVFITVLDTQDTPPEFIGAPFHATVAENSNPNITLLTIKAEDGDRGAPNSIKLMIVTGSETCPGLFEIDTNSGEITSISVLDRDDGDVFNNNGVCSLTIEAVEGSEHPQASNTSRSTSQTNVTITITDVDDNIPMFSASNFSASLDENTQQGVPITTSMQIIVNDKDQGSNAKFEVKVTNLPNIFEISPSIVQTTSEILIRVKNSTYLDYEQRQSIHIEIEAKSVNAAPNTKSSKADIFVKLKNLNDKSPIFGNFSTSVAVEEMRQNFKIMTIFATDNDRNDDGQNFGTVTYSLDGLDQNFELSTTGELKVKATAKLDRETQDLYYLTVIAEDGGHNKVTTQVTIKITDVNDCSPSFVTDDYQTSLQENSTTLSRSLKLHATDKDEQGKLNSEIEYFILSSIPSGLHSFFSIDPTSGDLTVVGALDYENNFSQGQDGKIVLTLMAKDKGSPPLNSTVDAIVMLQDINDNHPICNDSFNLTVPEDEKKSSVLVTVSGSDKDGTSPNNIIIYSIDQQNADKFIIDSNTGKISLRSDLDRETKDYYDITVTVNDLGLPSLKGQCHVTITVTDINDTPPSFNMPIKSVNITENEATHFINVTANDEDLHHKLKFDIDWSKSTATNLKGLQTAVNTSWLAINSMNGRIEVKSLDREIFTHFTLALTVEDEASQNGLQQDTTFMTIIVEDVNDNSPTFSRSSYQAEIQENMPDGSEIRTDYSLTVQDLDEGENSEFSVSLMNYNESFTIAPLSGKGFENCILSVKNSSILDFERVQELKLELLVTETKTNQKNSGTTTVTLSLINKNDNMPNFIGAPFTASINENMSALAPVTTVTAKDDDKEPFGVLSYSFHTPSAQFSINKTTGVVFTEIVLDRESQSSYTLTVYVEDVDHFGTMTQLTINVQDINDETPIFPQAVYNTSIPENQLSFIPPFIVQAFDRDQAGTKNSEIKYSINETIPKLPYQFHINNVSGEISLTNALDFEALDEKLHGRILVVVVANDQSSPFHSTTVTATINVIDVNDEVPEFGKSEYSVEQPENILIGSSVIQVQANDKDKSESNNRVSYMIDALSANTFIINNRTGGITIKNKLDREQNDHYNIIVTALDNGQPTQTSSVTVSIIVLDVNDSPPQFTMESAAIEITENLSKDIYTLKATDADANCNLSYSILWSSSSGVNGDGQYVDGNYLQNHININKSTGTVYPKHNLDREALQRLQLTLLVEDLNGLPDTLQNDTAILTVVVRDVNDNPPKFVGATKFLATIQENMPNGSELKFVNISSLTIDDPDGEGNNDYTIALNGSTAFSISPTQGAGKVSCIVTVADSSLLDFEKQQFFTLLVTATDNQNKSMHSKITITVQVMNENDNIPQFVNAPYTGRILEGSKENTPVTSVISIYANDSDLGEFGQVKYSLKDDNKRFAIDENSGLVYSLVNNLDREAAPSYTVTVIATDKGNFTAMSQLTIYLEDVDDNSPEFTQSEYNMDISEESDKFDSGFTVHAVDRDEPNNANSDVRYFLLDEGQPFYSYFKINETSGEVGIKTKLDFEAIPGGNISLTVMAQDQGTNHLNTTSKITVKVSDINDNAPEFYNNTYKFNISENANVGDIVGQVNSRDHDLSPVNNQVTYVIDALNANKFVIDTKGIIKVSEKLDREQTGLYNITVTALDTGHPIQSSSVTVTVNLLDVNDSPPQFTWKTKTINVKENSVELLASNKAVDLDENPSLVYSILWGESSGIDGDGQYIDGDKLKNYIKVGGTTSDINPNPTLDREVTQRFQLMLLVIDTSAIGLPQNDTALLTVIVEDEDDNFPNFVGGNSFQASIQENMPAGTEVKLTNISVLTIDDPDAVGNNRYNITLEGSSAFTITPSLGEGKTVCVITVAEADLVDFETTKSFQLKVTATGHSSTKNESKSADVFIQVVNENDNIPEFIGSPFHASIAENSTINTSVITINATDRDSGYFGNLSFSIKDDSNKFGIKRFTGAVYSIVSGFDREVTSSYVMTITVRDGGNFTATTQLTINVADINDETPTFTKTNYKVNIDENKKEFFPGFFVQAFDKDEQNTPNSNITYSLLNTEQIPESNFVINDTTGELYLNDCLDYETLNQTYRGGIVLIVEAKDQGNPPRSSTATITIIVGDVNDNFPKFTSSNGLLNIFENVTDGFKVAQIQAKDEDASAINNKVSYMIDILSANTFRIDNTTGIITVKNHLDREQIDQYNIIVTALDNGNPPLTSTVTVTVSLLDVNDSPPQFTWDTRTVNSRENVKTIIAVDEATDLDLNKDLLYTIVWSESSGIDGVGRFANGSKLQKYIGINTTTGEIYATEYLDREAIQRFQLTLMVEDIAAEGQKQNDTAILTVIIEDSNDQAPTFLKGNNFTARIRENMPVGSEVKFQNVAALIINDGDEGINSMYAISLVDNTVFTISPSQGEEQTPCVISVANASLLDFEKNESFTIEVVVSELLTSEHYNATASITIFLDNENDNFPIFKEPSMDVSVPENSKLGYPVTTVQATDADAGEFGRVYYSIDGDQKRFIINKNTGEITLNSTDLDWETMKAYSLTVRATDSGHFDSSLQLNVKVTDVNDQPPIFKTEFSAVVDENSLSFHSPLFVQADDDDEPGTRNSQIVYFITQTPSQLGSNSVFLINNLSGEISMSKSLDFEELFRKNASNEILQLEITAKDQGLPQLNGSTIVKVIVKDVNDIAPNFTYASYKFTVEENSGPGHMLMLLKII